LACSSAASLGSFSTLKERNMNVVTRWTPLFGALVITLATLSAAPPAAALSDHVKGKVLAHLDHNDMRQDKALFDGKKFVGGVDFVVINEYFADYMNHLNRAIGAWNKISKRDKGSPDARALAVRLQAAAKWGNAMQPEYPLLEKAYKEKAASARQDAFASLEKDESAMRQCNSFHTTYEQDLKNPDLQKTASNIRTLLVRKREKTKTTFVFSSGGSKSGNWGAAPNVANLIEKFEAAKAFKGKFGAICASEKFTSVVSPGCSSGLRIAVERAYRAKIMKYYKSKDAFEGDYKTKQQAWRQLENYLTDTNHPQNPTYLCQAATADVVSLYQKEVRTMVEQDMATELAYFAKAENCIGSSASRLNDILPTADIGKWKTKYEKLYAAVGLDINELDSNAESLKTNRAAGSKRIEGLATAKKAPAKQGKNAKILKLGAKRLKKSELYKKAKTLKIYSTSETWKINKAHKLPVNRIWFGYAILKLATEKKWCVGVEFYGDSEYAGGGRYGDAVGKSGNRHCFMKCP